MLQLCPAVPDEGHTLEIDWFPKTERAEWYLDKKFLDESDMDPLMFQRLVKKQDFFDCTHCGAPLNLLIKRVTQE